MAAKTSYHYPFVPRDYYPAVMFACKMIRENGFYNQAISRAASYYGVDESTLEKHVRARQAAGQKGKRRGKMKWFVCAEICGNDVAGDSPPKYSIVRGLSRETVMRRFASKDWEFTRKSDYGGSHAPYVLHQVSQAFDTKSQAEDALRELEEVKDGYGE